MEIREISVLVATPVASFIGAWLAARLALSRFYKEKVWERKVAVYSEMFNALHDINKYHEEQLLGHSDNSLPKEEIDQLAARLRTGYELIKRRLDADTWLLPGKVRRPLARLDRELNIDSYRSQEALLSRRTQVSRQTIEDLRRIVRKDLRLRDSLFSRIFEYLRVQYDTWRWRKGYYTSDH
jgi:hypothetical protein